MVDIAAKKAEGKGKGYEKWATLHNLKQAATVSIYGESGFSSPEELEAALAAASAGLHETTGKLKAVESTLREKKDLQKQLLAYIKTKPAREGLRAQKTEKARRAYREQHESKFIISEAALLHRADRKRCTECGGYFLPKSNRGKYCPECAAKVRRRKEADRQRKRYRLSTHLGYERSP